MLTVQLPVEPAAPSYTVYGSRWEPTHEAGQLSASCQPRVGILSAARANEQKLDAFKVGRLTSRTAQRWISQCPGFLQLPGDPSGWLLAAKPETCMFHARLGSLGLLTSLVEPSVPIRGNGPLVCTPRQAYWSRPLSKSPCPSACILDADAWLTLYQIRSAPMNQAHAATSRPRLGHNRPWPMHITRSCKSASPSGH